MDDQCFGSEQRTCPLPEGDRCESGSFAATGCSRLRRRANPYHYPHLYPDIDPYLHTFRDMDQHRSCDMDTITYPNQFTNANLYPYTHTKPYADPYRITNTDKHPNVNAHSNVNAHAYLDINTHANANTHPNQYTASTPSFPDCFVSGWPE